jgi:hypothetical protein
MQQLLSEFLIALTVYMIKKITIGFVGLNPCNGETGTST